MESKLSAPFSIYFLHGASCSGKSTLQTILIEDIANKLGSKLYKQFLELSNIKFTDRLRRKSEIEKKYIMQKNIVDDETFTRLNDSEEFFMTYSYNGKRYGFSSSALEEQINFSLQNPNSQFQYPIFFDNSSPNLPVITNKKLIDEINDKLSVHELDLKFDIKKILVFSSLDTTRTKFSYRFNESKGIEEYLIERADNDLEENLYFLNKLLKYTHFSCPFLFRDRAKMEEKQADDERLISCLDYSKKIEFLQAGYSRGNFDSMSIMESLNLITDKNEEKFSIIGLMEVLKEYFSPASLYKKHLIKSTKNSKHKNTIGKYSANLKIYYKKIAESFCKKIKKQYETLKKKKTLNPQKNVFFGKKKKKLENKIKEEKYDCLEKLINNYFDPEFDVNNINDNLKRIYNDFIINYATLDFKSNFFGSRQTQEYLSLIEKEKLLKYSLDVYKNLGMESKIIKDLQTLLDDTYERKQIVEGKLNSIFDIDRYEISEKIVIDLKEKLVQIRDEFDSIFNYNKKNRKSNISMKDIQIVIRNISQLYSEQYMRYKRHSNPEFNEPEYRLKGKENISLERWLLKRRIKKKSKKKYTNKSKIKNIRTRDLLPFLKYFETFRENEIVELPILIENRDKVYSDILTVFKEIISQSDLRKSESVHLIKSYTENILNVLFSSTTNTKQSSVNKSILTQNISFIEDLNKILKNYSKLKLCQIENENSDEKESILLETLLNKLYLKNPFNFTSERIIA